MTVSRSLVLGLFTLAFMNACGKKAEQGGTGAETPGAGHCRAAAWRQRSRQRRPVDVPRSRLQRTAFQSADEDQRRQCRAARACWFADFDTRRGQESTPLVVDGVLYVTTAWSKLYAYEAKTGKELWKYDPMVPGEWAVNACCDVVNRGVAAWNGRIYLATIDARLIALDAATGKVVWDVLTIEKGQPYSITGAPRVARGKVLIGQGGSEFSMRGYVSAYDAETGKLDWRWYVVPGDPARGFENPQMEAAAKTWKGDWWKTGGGGAPWDSIIYDPATNYVLVGTGSGAPWPSEYRSPGGGDNLYLSSIVALDLDTASMRGITRPHPARAGTTTILRSCSPPISS